MLGQQSDSCLHYAESTRTKANHGAYSRGAICPPLRLSARQRTRAAQPILHRVHPSIPGVPGRCFGSRGRCSGLSRRRRPGDVIPGFEDDHLLSGPEL